VVEPEPAALLDGYWRAADVYHVVDGDTFDAELDMGHRQRRDERLRLLGVNAPELHASNPDDRLKAQEARDFVIAWLEEHRTHNTLSLTWASREQYPFNIRSVKSDSFGRWLAAVECQQAHDLATALLDNGLAVPFRGGI
jgi:endonuclease YncB( thermonuclease family)